MEPLDPALERSACLFTAGSGKSRFAPLGVEYLPRALESREGPPGEEVQANYRPECM